MNDAVHKAKVQSLALPHSPSSLTQSDWTPGSDWTQEGLCSMAACPQTQPSAHSLHSRSESRTPRPDEGEMEREATWHLTQSSFPQSLRTSLPRAAASDFLPLPPKPLSIWGQGSYLLLHHPLRPSLPSFRPLLTGLVREPGWASFIPSHRGNTAESPRAQGSLGCRMHGWGFG